MGLECGSIKGLEGVGIGYMRVENGVGEIGLRCGEGRVAADFFICRLPFFVNPPPPSILIRV